MRRVACALLVLALLAPAEAHAAIFYLGTAWDACSGGCNDEPGCGDSPANACATLDYWTETRESAAGFTNGDTLRIAGTLSCTGGAACSHHCLTTTTGATYEGRNTNDTAIGAYDVAVIDGSNVAANSSPCFGRTFEGENTDFTDVTLRDLTLSNAQRNVNAFTGVRFSPSGCSGTGSTCSGLTIENVRINGNTLGGIQIGRNDNDETNPCSNSYDTTSVSIDNLLVDNNAGVGGMFSCIDGFTMINSEADSNRHADCSGGACDNDNGFIFGVKNFTITDSSSHDNGEDNWDFANPDNDDCAGTMFNGTAERLTSYDSVTGSLYSFSHCANNFTFRNNFGWGSGACINQKSCAHHIKFYNNTCYGMTRAVQMFENCRGCDFRNNIFVCAGASSKCAWTDGHSAGSETIWLNNLIAEVNGSTSMTAISVNVGEAANQADGRCPAASKPQSPGHEVAEPSLEPSLTVTQLSTFKSGCTAGDYFGPGDCQGDVWNSNPSFVNAASPSRTNLSLNASTDTVAQDAGTSISPNFPDWEGDARPSTGAWDIGADQTNEAGATCGNGTIEGDEQCDDGTSNGDTKPCTSSCLSATCGDGLVCSDAACTSGEGGTPEQCDDGGMNAATKSCTDTCYNAVCDDAKVCSDAACTSGPSGGPEQCDRGAALNSDTGICTDSCADATCGDSLVCAESNCTTGPGGGPEECDPDDSTCGVGGPFVCTACECVPAPTTTTTLVAPTTTTTTLVPSHPGNLMRGGSLLGGSIR